MLWMHGYRGTKEQFFESLERYVVHGLHDLTLRHPNLEGKQATEDSLDFLGGIFDHAKGTRCIMNIDVAKFKERIVEVCAEEIRKRQIDQKGRWLLQYLLQKLTALLTYSAPVRRPASWKRYYCRIYGEIGNFPERQPALVIQRL